MIVYVQSEAVFQLDQDQYIEGFCTIFSFDDPTTKKRFTAKTVLQLCINPDSYKVGPQTIGAMTEIDSHFSNEELEWSTKQRGAIILYGLLVKLDDRK